MHDTRLIMGMPVSVEIAGRESPGLLEEVFRWFIRVDEAFSTYKPQSEISRLNSGELQFRKTSPEVREILRLAEETKAETGGYFDMRTPQGRLDPSGIVKGWAIREAARLLDRKDIKNFYVDAGGDIEVRGVNSAGQPWRVGIRNPQNREEIIKVLRLPSGTGIATSGTYIRGRHIWNPKTGRPAEEFLSLTVIGPDAYEADRFATAAFAMGWNGLKFLAGRPGLEALALSADGQAVSTPGFARYQTNHV